MTICSLARSKPDGQFKDNEWPISDQFLRGGGVMIDPRLSCAVMGSVTELVAPASLFFLRNIQRTTPFRPFEKFPLVFQSGALGRVRRGDQGTFTSKPVSLPQCKTAARQIIYSEMRRSLTNSH
jgi:hypothetical protein